MLNIYIIQPNTPTDEAKDGCGSRELTAALLELMRIQSERVVNSDNIFVNVVGVIDEIFVIRSSADTTNQKTDTNSSPTLSSFLC